MTRIIAGTAGGRTLRTPPGSGTRPTSDRVREALFSALDARHAVRGSRVLDLYAGSGALGLEASSRGASCVVLVESDRRAADVISRNVRDLGLPGIRVACVTVAAHLAPDPSADAAAHPAMASKPCPPRHPGDIDRGYLRGLRSLRLYLQMIWQERYSLRWGVERGEGEGMALDAARGISRATSDRAWRDYLPDDPGEVSI